MSKDYKYIIIGAGLSGLVTARQLFLAGETDFLMLEGRDRSGGRILTSEGVDLGATWFQAHHAHLTALLSELKLEKFPQYSAGKSILVYNTMAPAHYFEQDQSAAGAARIAGGSAALIEALSAPIAKHIRLHTRVTGISELAKGLKVHTDQGSFRAQKVVSTLPPRLAASLDYAPALPPPLHAAMSQTHTWMSNAIKVGLVYDRPFWREKGFSGTIIGQVGPAIEMYDHSDASETHFALMGFVNEGLRDSIPEKRKARILDHLEKFLGPEVQDFQHYFEKDWSADEFTAAAQLNSVNMGPEYGNPLFAEAAFAGKLWFSGAETSPVHGGYMDGAVYSGLWVANQFLASKKGN